MFAKRESEKYACACKAYGLRLCPVANIYSGYDVGCVNVLRKLNDA